MIPMKAVSNHGRPYFEDEFQTIRRYSAVFIYFITFFPCVEMKMPCSVFVAGRPERS